MSAMALNQQFANGSSRLARQVEGAHAPEPVVGAARSGDLFATMTEVPDGIASACALALPEMDEEFLRKLLAHLDKVPTICIPIPPQAQVVTIEVPPLPRID